MRPVGPAILLVFDTPAIGDVIQRIPAAAAALRSIFPRIRLDVLTRQIPGVLLGADPGFGQVFQTESTMDCPRPGEYQFSAEFAARTYDAVLNVGSSLAHEIQTLTGVCALCRQKNPSCIVDLGMAEACRGNLLRAVMNLANERRQFQHRLDYILDGCGLPGGYRAGLSLDPAFRVERPSHAAEKPLIFLHTTSNAPARCYRRGDELRTALKTAGYATWDAEGAKFDLRAVAWMIHQSDYVVTVDTSILHIANGLKISSLCLVTQIIPPWVGVDDFCFEPTECAFCITRKIRGHESEPCAKNFACMSVDPAEVVERVAAYFDLQSLKDTPRLRRYLFVRRQQHELIRAISQGKPADARTFDVNMAAPKTAMNLAAAA